MRHRGSPGISQTMPTPAQLEAAITAMCLVGYADGELSAAELGVLGQKLDAAGWCEALSDAQIHELFVRSVDRAHAIWELPDDTARDDAIVQLVVELDSLEIDDMAAAVAAIAGPPAATTLQSLVKARSAV